MPLLRVLAALLLLGSAGARADSLISGLPAAAIPLAAGTCLVTDQTGTTGKLCSNYPAAIGALAISNNLSDLANAATARTNLGLAAIAASGSASDLAAGTLPALRFPALTGAVTTAAGSLSTTLSAGAVGTGNLAGSAVTYAKIQNETAATLLGNPTGSSAAPSEITLGSNLSFSGGVLNAAGGGSTTIPLGPGLGNSQTSFNGTGTAQTVTNGSTLYPQMGSVAKTGAYTLNADCSGGVLCDTARVVLANGAGSIAITAPTAAGTIAPYQIADESGHGFTVPTVGGTDTFKGCIAGVPTTLTVPPNYAVQLFDQGAGNGYFCVLQPEQQIAGASGANPSATAGPTAINGSAATFMRSDAAPAVQVGSASQQGILQCGSGTTCSGGTISVSGGGSAPGATSGYAAGHVYGAWPGSYVTNAGLMGANGIIECAPLTIYAPGVHIDSLNVDVTTAAAGTHVELALYNSGSNGLPSTLLINTSSLSTAATGVAAGSITSTALSAGNYWLCAQVDTATADFVTIGSGQFDSGTAALAGSDTAADYFAKNQSAGGFNTFPYFAEGTYGTWPSLTSLWSASQMAASMPSIVWHAASVP